MVLARTTTRSPSWQRTSPRWQSSIHSGCMNFFECLSDIKIQLNVWRTPFVKAWVLMDTVCQGLGFDGHRLSRPVFWWTPFVEAWVLISSTWMMSDCQHKVEEYKVYLGLHLNVYSNQGYCNKQVPSTLPSRLCKNAEEWWSYTTGLCLPWHTSWSCSM